MISVVSYLQLFPEFLWNYGCIPTNMRLKLNKSVKKLISNYNLSLSIKMSVSSLYWNLQPVSVSFTWSHMIQYAHSSPTSASTAPDLQWQFQYLIGFSSSDALMRERRIEIRKQPTIAIETNTRDFALFNWTQCKNFFHGCKRLI